MISHVSINVSDYQRAKEYYARCLKPLGYELISDMPDVKVAGFGSDGKLDFWIYGEGSRQGTHVAFMAQNKEMVQSFYDEALKAGGKDNGKPEYQTDYSPGYFAGYVFDPDGNNIEAVWMDPEMM